MQQFTIYRPVKQSIGFSQSADWMVKNALACFLFSVFVNHACHMVPLVLSSYHGHSQDFVLGGANPCGIAVGVSGSF